MDKLKIDSHKLIYHVDRVNDWLNGKLVYPIYMEISPIGACNHRCTYCGLDFMEYQNRFLGTKILKERLTELAKLGLKSVMFAGEGEPFLHKDIAEIVAHTKKSGIDVAITTNGVLFDEKLSKEILEYTEWIKVGIDAATAGTFAKIHRAQKSDFKKIVDNLSYAVNLKKKNKLKATLGVQLLLLPENYDEVLLLAKLTRDIGADYLVVKPYSQHPQSKTKKYKDIKYDEYDNLAKELDEFNTDKFSVIFRKYTMQKWDSAARDYCHCLALPFWSYIDAGGNVWGCSVYLNDQKFYYGNIYENNFSDIWQGEKRRQSLDWCEKELNTAQCRINCRMDEINRYLWELKYAPEHVNFI